MPWLLVCRFKGIKSKFKNDMDYYSILNRYRSFFNTFIGLILGKKNDFFFELRRAFKICYKMQANEIFFDLSLSN